ncbi:MAG: AraC family transcriptional regulator [Tannerellaceae bacterium]|jgi:AraC-like DNA-binding protein|nr:AraC family transcriptional regulator [Tannerellaceae bacterium]
MKKSITNELSELNSLSSLFNVYDDVLGVADVSYSSLEKHVQTAGYHLPVQSNKIGMMWTTSGECVIQLEGRLYSLSGYSFMLIPSGESVYISSVTPDIKAKMLFADKTFMDECIINKQILSFFNCLLVKRMLQTELEAEDIRMLNTDLDYLSEKIKDENHSHYNEVAPINFISLLLDVSHILSNKRERKIVSFQFSRKEELFNKFLDLLLNHYKEQHEVAFYAEQLFITPQYLTFIIKELTGKTTNKWIDDRLIIEARKLLKTTQTTVQQIADQLNFSDQSTFGKFFKKYHGVSPAEYRKLYYNSLSIA